MSVSFLLKPLEFVYIRTMNGCPHDGVSGLRFHVERAAPGCALDHNLYYSPHSPLAMKHFSIKLVLLSILTLGCIQSVGQLAPVAKPER